MNNYSKKSTRKGIEAITLKKTFNCFSDGIIEMGTLNSTIGQLLGVSEESENVTIEDIYSKIIDITKENYPDIVNRNNVHWEFQISARRIYVKTGLFVGFGWDVKSSRTNKDDQAIIQNQYNMKIVLFGINQNDAKKKLLENGWVVEERYNKEK